MAFDFDKLKDNIVSAGREVGEKVQEASQIAKIKYDIHSQQTFLDKQYALLGRAYYNEHKDDDVEEKEYFPSIKEAEKEIVRLQEELLDVQGAVLCSACGTKQTKQNDFCSNCGNALKS